MADYENNNVNFEGNEETEHEAGSGNMGKIIAGAVGIGVGAFALGQTVGKKIGNPLDVAKRMKAKHDAKKLERDAKKLEKQRKKLTEKLDKLDKPADPPETVSSETSES